MKPQFQHLSITSLALWFDWFLINKGEAFSVKTASLQLQEDDRLDPSYISYASPFKQWVYDSGIENVQVPTSITDVSTGEEITRGEDGMIFDFQNGRVLFPNLPINQNLDLEATFSVKDFNVYLTDQTEEELIIENKYDVNSRFYSAEIPIEPYSEVIPAVFISLEESNNVPYAFGGEDETYLNFRSVVFSENLYQLDGVLSIFRDSKLTGFPELEFHDHPLDEFGDIKDGISEADPNGFEYSYPALAQSRKTGADFYIKDCSVSKLKESVSNNGIDNLFIGFVDFEVTKVRYPRA
jgi:hypothetical protein